VTDAPDISRRRRLWRLARSAGQLTLAIALAAAALVALVTGTPLASLLLAAAAVVAAASFRRGLLMHGAPAHEERSVAVQILDGLRDDGWTVRHQVVWDELSPELDHVAIPPHGLAAFVVDSAGAGEHRLEQLVDGAAWVAARRRCRQGALPVVIVDGAGINELSHINREGAAVPILYVSVDEVLVALPDCAAAAADQHVAAGAH